MNINKNIFRKFKLSNFINISNNKKNNYCNLEKLLKERYNNIQNKIKVINIVGTNGKGSVASYLQKQLINHYKYVGLFISPAFLEHNERIKINNIFISDKQIYKILKEIKKNIKLYFLNFFEIWVLICIFHFIENKVNIAIIEAGIGGIKDCTNVFNNQILVALTSISYDHINILGKNIKSIIYNKVNILKNNNKLIISYNVKKYLNIISKFISYKNILIANKYNYNNLSYYQSYNIGLVIKIMNFLNLIIDYSIFKKNPLLGRFTILNFKPYFIIDGAHNTEGIILMIKNIHFLNINKNKNFLVLFASSKNKEYKKILKILKLNFGLNLFITFFKHDLSWKDKNIFNYNKVYNWKKFIKKNINKNIIVCGSLYFIPLVYKFYKKIYK